MTNRQLAILASTLLGGLLVHSEIRMGRLEDQIMELKKEIFKLEHKMDDIVQTGETVKYTKKDLECLVKNIYYEAGVEDERGKYAVGHVTVNRLKTGYWGKTICDVVYAKAQFSWTLKKKLPKADPNVWAQSEKIALDILNGHRVHGLKKSLFYHATYIKEPKWVDVKHEAGQIGSHVFYNRAKGSNLYI